MLEWKWTRNTTPPLPSPNSQLPTPNHTAGCASIHFSPSPIAIIIVSLQTQYSLITINNGDRQGWWNTSTNFVHNYISLSVYLHIYIYIMNSPLPLQSIKRKKQLRQMPFQHYLCSITSISLKKKRTSLGSSW